MGKNTQGGKHHKRGKNSNSDKTRQITYANNEETVYGLVVSALGSGRFMIHCSDRVNRCGKIRGSMYKKKFINPEDLVLVSLRTCETKKDDVTEKCDIIMSYNSQEIDQLKANGLYYKNSNVPFCTVLENGKPAQMHETDDVFKFSNNKEEDYEPYKKNDVLPKAEDEDEDDIYDEDKDFTYVQPTKTSNVKVIGSDSEPFDFDAI